MLGNLQLALMTNTNHIIQEYLESAKMAGELLIHLINNILDRGKVELNDLEISTNIVEIRPLLKKYGPSVLT